MVVFGNQKYACLSCIRGHRSSSCDHRQRILLQVRKPGRRSQAELKSRYVLVWKESFSAAEPNGQYKLMKVPEEDVNSTNSRTPTIPLDPKEQVPLEDNDDEVVLTDKYVFVHVGNNLFRRELKPSYIDGNQRKIEHAAPGMVTSPSNTSPESSGRCCKLKNNRNAEPVKRTPDRRLIAGLDHIQSMRNSNSNQLDPYHPSIATRLASSSSPISPIQSENGYPTNSHPQTPLRATSVPADYQNSHNGNVQIAGGHIPPVHPQIAMNQMALPVMPLNGAPTGYHRGSMPNPGMPLGMTPVMGSTGMPVSLNGAPNGLMLGHRPINGLHPSMHPGNMPLNIARPHPMSPNTVTSPNSVSSNSVSPNSLSSNSVSTNSLSANSLSANSLSANSLSANSLSANSLSANSVSVNGSVNGSGNGMRNGNLSSNNQSLSGNTMPRSSLSHSGMPAASVRTPPMVQPSPNPPDSSGSQHHPYIEPKQEIDTINDELDELFIASNNNAPLVIGPMQFQQDGVNTRSNILNELGITEQEASELWPQTEYNAPGHFTYAAQCVLPGQCQCGEGCQCPDCYEHRRGRHNTFG